MKHVNKAYEFNELQLALYLWCCYLMCMESKVAVHVHSVETRIWHMHLFDCKQKETLC